MYEDETVAVQPMAEQSEIDQLYHDLGKAYYEGGFEDPLPQLLPLFDKITVLKNRNMQEVKCCRQCGTLLKEGAVFCGECGLKVR